MFVTIPRKWRSIRDRHLTKLSQKLADAGVIQAKVIRPWRDDAGFRAMMARIRDRTIVDDVRCYMLLQLARQASSVAGDVAEVGVYRGGTARLLAETMCPHGKALHLFDTFEGMPATDPSKDFHREGDFSDNSLSAVKAFVAGAGDVRFYPGFFPGSATPVEPLTFAFVHVDTDIYSSVLDCCRFFYPRLARGGCMVFDDYGFLSCPGALAAVDEFFADLPDKAIYLPTGQAFVSKR